MAKKRLDILMMEQGLADSRQRAQAMIMAGQVYIGSQRYDKAGAQVEENAVLQVRGNELRYVSRGGLKLEKALSQFPLVLEGTVAADIGASTGGFTDCMLQHGAKRVYAVDVGYGQLAWSLRQDARVVCLERTNARYLTTEIIPEPLQFASIDVSFISLNLILPAIRSLMAPEGQIVALIKPQFEAGKEKVGKNGVVRDSNVHLEVLEHIFLYAQHADLSIAGLTWSPVRGPKGNIEYLGWLTVGGGQSGQYDLQELVRCSHESLGG